MNIAKAAQIALLITCLLGAANQSEANNRGPAQKGVAITQGGMSGTVPPAAANGCVLAETQYPIQVNAQGGCDTTYINISMSASPSVNLYVRFKQKVTIEEGRVMADYKAEGQETIKTIVLAPPYQAGTYYIAVTNCGAEAASYDIGMGIFVVDYFGPLIKRVSMSGKKLLIFGCFIREGAVILMNDEEQPTQYSERDGMSLLISKKAGKRLDPGESVVLQVRDINGRISVPFTFTRPVE